MATQLLNLPVNISWKQIAVSPDMMDTDFGNRRFPYLKVAGTITGYQPTKEDTEKGYVSFPDGPMEQLSRIFEEYFACYGVLPVYMGLINSRGGASNEPVMEVIR